MQKNRGNHTLYADSLAQGSTLAAQSVMPSNEDTSLQRSLFPRLYNDIETCPLSVFLDCLFDNYLHGLVISGTPTLHELRAAWQTIYEDYCTQSDTGVSDHVAAIKEYNLALAKIKFIDAAMHCLSTAHIPDLNAMLLDLGIRTDIIGTETQEQLLAKLQKAKTRAKKLVIEYEQARKRVDDIQAAAAKNKSTRAYYSDALMAISRENGYHVKATETTVAQFLRETKRLITKSQRHGNRANK